MRGGRTHCPTWSSQIWTDWARVARRVPGAGSDDRRAKERRDEKKVLRLPRTAAERLCRGSSIELDARLRWQGHGPAARTSRRHGRGKAVRTAGASIRGDRHRLRAPLRGRRRRRIVRVCPRPHLEPDHRRGAQGNEGHEGQQGREMSKYGSHPVSLSSSSAVEHEAPNAVWSCREALQGAFRTRPFDYGLSTY